MEEFEKQLEVYWASLKELAGILTTEQWAGVGGGVVFLMLIGAISRSSKKKKIKKSAPKLLMHTFQIAPLGKDAFFKIRNIGEQATLTELALKGRNDIEVKNAFAGHQIEKEKVYGLLLESTSNKKIRPDFSIELTFMDKNGNVYKQLFEPEQNGARQAKLIKYK